MEFTAEEILEDRVCQWCVKTKCPLRYKIPVRHCKEVEFNASTRARLSSWNTVREKVLLTHAFTTQGKNRFDDEEFRKWFKETYKDTKIHE